MAISQYLGFTASAVTRAGAALILSALAFAGVWKMDRAKVNTLPSPSPSQALQPGAKQSVDLRLESTCDITRWSVSVNQKVLTPAESDARHWAAVVEVTPKSEIILDTEATPGTLERAIRFTAKTAEHKVQRVFWGENDIVERLVWEKLMP